MSEKKREVIKDITYRFQIERYRCVFTEDKESVYLQETKHKHLSIPLRILKEFIQIIESFKV